MWVSKDDKEAVRLYRLAADQGDALAQAKLGAMYEQGRRGLTKDSSEALRLYRLPARCKKILRVRRLAWLIVYMRDPPVPPFFEIRL
jgi:TPR repeat protein